VNLERRANKFKKDGERKTAIPPMRKVLRKRKNSEG